MVAGGRVVVIDNTRHVIELDEDHWAQDAVIKRVCVVAWPDPGEMRFGQIALRLGVADFSVARPNAARVGREQRLETVAALRRELGIADAGAINPPVVAKGGCQQLTREIFSDRCTRLFVRRQRTHQGKALLLLGGENARSHVFARARKHWFGAHETGRQNELIAEDEAVDIQMMAVDLPSPGLLWRRRPEDADPIEPLAVFLSLAGNLEDVLVEAHDVAGSAIPRGAHGFLQQSERAFTLATIKVGQAHTVTHQPRVNVRP